MDFTTTTLRIEKTLLGAFQQKLQAEASSDKPLSMNKLLQTWIEDWTKGGKEPGRAPQLSVDSQAMLADLLAARVAQLLQLDKTWALNVVRTAHLRWPAEGVLKERMGHYPMDKVFCSEKFSEFLFRRIEYFLDEEGADVYLLLDAGSTVLYLCYSLWKHLEVLSTKPRKTKVFLISTNLPAAESFTEECHLNRFKGNTGITFELLGGTVQPRYAALTGKMTEDALAERTNSKKLSGRFIALVAGNYIRLSEGVQPAYPIPLVRGEGQKEVKELMFRHSDEAYILGAAPGKIFDAKNKLVNVALGNPYKDVLIPPAKRANVKLVTALRKTPDAILSRHSTAVATRLGFNDLVDSRNDAAALLKDLADMSHLCYWYDDPIMDTTTGRAKSILEQRRIEFPHLAWGKEGEPASRASLDVLQEFFQIEPTPGERTSD